MLRGPASFFPSLLSRALPKLCPRAPSFFLLLCLYLFFSPLSVSSPRLLRQRQPKREEQREKKKVAASDMPYRHRTCRARYRVTKRKKRR